MDKLIPQKILSSLTANRKRWLPNLRQWAVLLPYVWFYKDITPG